AVEEAELSASGLRGTRRESTSSNCHEVEAAFDSEGRVTHLRLRYQRGPFSRSAVYECDGEVMKGSVNGLGGRTEVQTKLGRLREIDADLLVFKALILAHIRERGQVRWTGRVVKID